MPSTPIFDAPPDGAETLLLTTADRNSALWRKIEEHLQQHLTLLRARNDGPLDEIETASLRGQIKTLKGFLALGDEPEPPTNDG